MDESTNRDAFNANSGLRPSDLSRQDKIKHEFLAAPLHAALTRAQAIYEARKQSDHWMGERDQIKREVTYEHAVEQLKRTHANADRYFDQRCWNEQRRLFAKYKAEVQAPRPTNVPPPRERSKEEVQEEARTITKAAIETSLIRQVEDFRTRLDSHALEAFRRGPQRDQQHER